MPTELLDGVHDVTCAETETDHVYAFLFDDGTLVDRGLPSTADALLNGIAATGVDPERLVVIHADPDHVGGFDAVVRKLWLGTHVPEDAAPESEYELDHRHDDGDAVGPFEAVRVPGHRDHRHALVDEARGVAVLADAVSGVDQRGRPTSSICRRASTPTTSTASRRRWSGSLLLSDAGETLEAHSTGGAGGVLQGRSEIADFRDEETLRVSNHSTPRRLTGGSRYSAMRSPTSRPLSTARWTRPSPATQSPAK